MQVMDDDEAKRYILDLDEKVLDSVEYLVNKMGCPMFIGFLAGIQDERKRNAHPAPPA